MNTRAVRRAGLALALAATAGCAGGSSMAETIESVFERNPEEVAETCSTTAAMASSRDELLSLLDSLSDEQRADMQAAMASGRSSAGTERSRKVRRCGARSTSSASPNGSGADGSRVGVVAALTLEPLPGLLGIHAEHEGGNFFAGWVLPKDRRTDLAEELVKVRSRAVRAHNRHGAVTAPPVKQARCGRCRPEGRCARWRPATRH